MRVPGLGETNARFCDEEVEQLLRYLHGNALLLVSCHLSHGVHPDKFSHSEHSLLLTNKTLEIHLLSLCPMKGLFVKAMHIAPGRSPAPPCTSRRFPAAGATAPSNRAGSPARAGPGSRPPGLHETPRRLFLLAAGPQKPPCPVRVPAWLVLPGQGSAVRDSIPPSGSGRHRSLDRKSVV